MIEVKNVTRKFGEKIAVSNVSFSVEKGKIWGFLGPNGAGKTTTMRIITGYLPPTEGEAIVSGFNVVSAPYEVKKRIGYLPEVPPLYPEMTVYEYLTFVAELKGLRKRELKNRVEEVIEKTGLKDVKKRLIKNISKGYRQRVGIAQAIVHNPDVLILDEPTIGLDPAQIVEIRSLIRSLKGEHTIILSTHILSEVTQICDGVAIINEGELKVSDLIDKIAQKFKEEEGIFLKTNPKLKEDDLTSLKGIKKVTKDGDGYKIYWEDKESGERELVFFIAQKSVSIVEWRSLEPSLEELYMKIISGGVQ